MNIDFTIKVLKAGCRSHLSKWIMASGIYAIKNIINNNIYIGSALCFNHRWSEHKKSLLNNVHCNSKLQRAWNKYGGDNFIYEILELCEPEKLILFEQKYMNDLNPEYNICKQAGSWFGMKHKPETIIKMKKPKTEAHKNKLRKPRTEQARRNMSLAKMGIAGKPKGFKASSQTIENRLANIGRRYSKEVNLKKGRKGDLHHNFGKGKCIIQFDLFNNPIKEFISSSHVERELKFFNSNILKCCKGKIPTAYGYKWKYKI